jgi:hypothetical protein
MGVEETRISQPQSKRRDHYPSQYLKMKRSWKMERARRLVELKLLSWKAKISR